MRREMKRVGLLALLLIGLVVPVAVGGAHAAVDQPVLAAVVPTRYFGRTPFEAIQSASAEATRPCSLTDDALTAMVLGPVFKESSAATTPEQAPSPMTLSRYDEWSGLYPPPLGDAADTTRNANYGLYAFRNPYTAYQRAFWSPGVGIWQLDVAGLGAPLNTVEAMDVGVTAADLAGGMVQRYCAAAAGSTPLQRRYAAWSPWGVPCTACETVFQDLMTTVPTFATLGLVDGISATGGVQARTCTLIGVAGTVPCWFVDPRVGVIEGATGWATLDPTGGSGPTVAPTPLPAPFYVVDRGTTEERHWLRADSGYGVDITASRTIGKDARPRPTKPGTGLAWTASSGLCDLTTGRGVCVGLPPNGITASSVTADATGRAVHLDADGDGRGDVLWYGPGDAADSLWLGQGSGAFTTAPLRIAGRFDDVLTGDIDGDGRDDVVFYTRATGIGYLWRSFSGGAWASVRLTPGAGLRPFLLDTDGDGRLQVFWYGPGTLSDAIWAWSGSGFTATARSVGGSYQPLIGDFDGNHRDDIFWYGPGSAVDHLWLHSGTGGIVSRDRPVSGFYEPLVGDFDGDHRSDIVWYAAGPTWDHVWFGGPGGVFTDQPMTVSGTYDPVVVDLVGEGRDDVLWSAAGTAPDRWMTWTSGRARSVAAAVLPGAQVPIVGGFSGGGADGIVWWGAGALADVVWWHG